jgi:hypothetical protein
MPKYVIDRHIPGAGKLTESELRAISRKSNGVIAQMKGEVQWLHSYVAGDHIYCVYIAPNEEAIQEHARHGAFPANVISKISTVIDPSTGE